MNTETRVSLEPKTPKTPGTRGNPGGTLIHPSLRETPTVSQEALNDIPTVFQETLDGTPKGIISSALKDSQTIGTMQEFKDTSTKHDSNFINSIKIQAVTVGNQTAITTLLGSTMGLIYAEIKALNKPSTVFHFTTKYFLLSLPFFTIRQSLLHLDYTKIQSTILSSSVIGGVIGALWRGKRAILPLALLHGTMGLGGQLIFNTIDSIRYNIAYSRLHPKTTKNETKITNPQDPIKTIFNTTRDFILHQFGITEIPNCIKYATDIQYRQKQLLKLGILRTQIKDLKQQLDEQ